MATDIIKTLSERGLTYGEYKDVSRTSQLIKEALRNGGSYSILSNEACESLDMIANKLARIVNGDPNYLDSWVDIVGYATLVINKLEGKS
jgi:hypothetical protein